MSTTYDKLSALAELLPYMTVQQNEKGEVIVNTGLFPSRLELENALDWVETLTYIEGEE